jgi:putative transposase
MDRITELSLQPGSPVLYQGKPYQIRQLTGNLKTVLLEDVISGQLLKAPIAHLAPPAPDTDPSIVRVMPLELVTDEQWLAAQRRLAIIQPLLTQKGDGQLLQAVAQQHGIGQATVYRWVRRYEATGQLSQLIPSRSNGGQGKSRLTPEVEVLLRAAVEEVYLTEQRHSIKWTYLDVIDRCKRHKLTIPHLNTVRKRIMAIRQERALRFRHGEKAADDKFRPQQGRYAGADFPLAVVQIDHTPGDIILVDDRTRAPLGKPWITMAIDAYSRMVVGYYISFETPGALGVGMCLANSLLPKEALLAKLNVAGEWPCWGKMKKILADNAKEFRGNMLKRACEEYGMDLEWRLVREPGTAPYIERLLGTFNKEIHELPGTTFSNPQQKGAYPSAEKAALTLGEFEQWLVHFIVNIYHQRPHSKLGCSPLAKFEDGIYQKTGLPPRIQNERKVKLDFLPYFERTVQEYGIVLDHIHYYSDVLRKWMHALEGDSPKSRRKRKFIFKRDPRDISILYFYDPEAKDYFEIPYRDLKKPPMTLWEHHQVLRQLESEGVKDIDETRFFEAHRKLQEIEEQAVRQTQIVRRERKRAKAKSSRDKSLKQELSTTPAAITPVISTASVAPPVSISQFPLSTGTIQPYDELEYGAFA